MSITSFRPDEFFAKTAHFASQGRGLFTLTPDTAKATQGAVDDGGHILDTTTTSRDYNKAKITEGLALLSRGLVAKNFSIPSLQLNTYEPFSYMGPTKKMPYGLQFSDLEVEFYLMGSSPSEAGSLHYLFSRWMEGIAGPRVGPRGGSNEFSVPDSDMPTSDATVFEVEYYNNYIASAEIRIYSPTDEVLPTTNNVTPPPKPQVITLVKFSELFPIALGPLQLSWESPDAPLSLSVTFAYYYHRVISVV